MGVRINKCYDCGIIVDAERFSIYDSSDRALWVYPEHAADVYVPVLNVTYLINSCDSKNVKYLLLYEFGNLTYFMSDWNYYYVFDKLIDSGRFTFETIVGTFPNRIVIIRFIPNS